MSKCQKNYELKSLSSRVRRKNRKTCGSHQQQYVPKVFIGTLKTVGHCEAHNIDIQFRCMDCDTWSCSTCILLDHGGCRTLPGSEASKEMLHSRDIAIAILDKTNEVDNISIPIKNLKNKTLELKIEIKNTQFNLKKIKKELVHKLKYLESLEVFRREEINCISSLKNLQSNSIDAFMQEIQNDRFSEEVFLHKINKDILEKFSKIPKKLFAVTFEHVKDYCQEKSLYAVRRHNGRTFYGKVTVNGGRVWVHCFKAQTPDLDNFFIPFRIILTSFSGSLELPRRAFLQISDGNSHVGDVVMETKAETPISQDFLLLQSSGLTGKSYIGNQIEVWRCEIEKDSMDRKRNVGIFRSEYWEEDLVAFSIVMEHDSLMVRDSKLIRSTPLMYATLGIKILYSSPEVGEDEIPVLEKIWDEKIENCVVENCGLVFG